MDQDIEIRFNETAKLLASNDKRIDDVKWFVGGIATLYTVIFSVLTLISSWNFSNEKEYIRQSLQDLKAELGKVEATPNIQILAQDKTSLEGKELAVLVTKDASGDYIIEIPCILRNMGDGMSGPLYAKIYTKEPLVRDDSSSDEPSYKYEKYIDPKDFGNFQLPGGKYSSSFVFSLDLANRKRRPPSGKHDLMLKIYYGKGKLSQAVFTAVISKGQDEETNRK